MHWKASHCVYDCRYHIVWITKYRRQVLNNEIKKRLETILTWVCKELNIRIIKIWMEEDHVHMYISIPVVHPIPYVVKRLKWRSSKVINDEFQSHLTKFYWKKRVLWAVWYFVATVWEVNHETIKNYVENQWKKDIEDECIELNPNSE